MQPQSSSRIVLNCDFFTLIIILQRQVLRGRQGDKPPNPSCSADGTFMARDGLRPTHIV